MEKSKITKCQVMESTNSKMVHFTKGNFKRTNLMAEESLMINLMILS